MTAEALSPGAVVEELRRLIALGRDRGTITADEVLIGLGSPEPTPQFIEAITELLGGQGIVVDPEEPVVDAVQAGPEATRPEPPPTRPVAGAGRAGGADLPGNAPRPG